MLFGLTFKIIFGVLMEGSKECCQRIIWSLQFIALARMFHTSQSSGTLYGIMLGVL